MGLNKYSFTYPSPRPVNSILYTEQNRVDGIRLT